MRPLRTRRRLQAMKVHLRDRKEQRLKEQRLKSPGSEVEERKLPTWRQLCMLPSVFDGRPPVLIFPYTEACGAEQRNMSRGVWIDVMAPKLLYAYDSLTEYNAIINTCRLGGLYKAKSRPGEERIEAGDWLLRWSRHVTGAELSVMNSRQKANHFPGATRLGQKDVLWRELSRMQERFGKAFCFAPETFLLPEAAEAWQAALEEPGALWISKPADGKQGIGIKVFCAAGADRAVKDGKDVVVQRYVKNPLLIDGFKFDLRLYVVILSYEPLKVYLFEEGLVRCATQVYCPSDTSLNERTMHLTNYSVNKKAEGFVKNQDTGDGTPASKMSLAELKAYASKAGWDYDLVMSRTKDVIIKTLIAMAPCQRKAWASALGTSDCWASRGGVKPSSCFECLGVDVLWDEDLRVWLLEINCFPSFSSGSLLDKRIKTKLVADVLTLVGLQPSEQVVAAATGLKVDLADLPEGRRRDARDATPRIPDPDKCEVRRKRTRKDLESTQDADACQVVRRPDRGRDVEVLRACSPREALSRFDEHAWDIVMTAFDEDMRSGGLERIFPREDTDKFLEYFDQVSYDDIVLQRWLQAGAAAAFESAPSWLPKQVCFERT